MTKDKLSRLHSNSTIQWEFKDFLLCFVLHQTAKNGSGFYFVATKGPLLFAISGVREENNKQGRNVVAR